MLSIIFLHWVEENGPLQETLMSLDSIIKYTTVPYELILVSNGSTQECRDAIEQRILNAPSEPKVEVIYIDLPTNQGVSKGFNAGLREISDEAKYISIYSNDWVCSPQWAELMIEELDKDPKCGFVTACTNWGSGSMCFAQENPVKFPKQEILPTDPLLFNRVEEIAQHTLQARGITTNNQFPAMGWTMKREIFDKLGYMDERIFCANDVAYGVRAFNLGYVSKTVWAAYIHHFWHASFSQINDRETYSYLRPKDEADLNLIRTDELYRK